MTAGMSFEITRVPSADGDDGDDDAGDDDGDGAGDDNGDIGRVESVEEADERG